MKKALKIVGIVFGVIVVLIAGLVVYWNLSYKRDFSSTPLPNIRASQDPAVIAQGEYIANAVAHCSACHGPASSVSQHQLATDLRDLRGGFTFEAGPFGNFHAANITQDRETGIGALSDGQLARAIRHGVDRHGRYAAFMAFAVGNMSDEDLTAVVSYLRTIPPVRNAVPADEWGIIAKALAGKFNPRTARAPRYVAASAEPNIARGEYLAGGPGHCLGCHTPSDPMEGFAPTGAPFSGEAMAEPDPTDPAYELVVPNLTPDPTTGVMASWDEQQFVSRFRAGRVHAGSRMPWESFARMTESDVRSIYRYLHALTPTRHETGPSRRRVQ